MIETGRLILRPFRDEDRGAFAQINAHPEVAVWLSGVMTRAESDAMVERITAHIAEHGFGFFAAERKADGRLVGAIGLQIMAADLPGAGAIELAWRLHPEAQGAGLAAEGAAACRDWAFEVLGAGEVLAITAEANLRSQAVMCRIGMSRDRSRDFNHPRLAPDHRLARHVVYAARRPPSGVP